MQIATLHTSKGNIQIELYEEKAPKTVENFLSYVKEGFYENTIFHRVIKGFMIQCGGHDKEMNRKLCKASIEHEGHNGLKNERGTIAMARTNDPHSASSQFFINLVDNEFLNFKSPTADGWGYCVFAKVTDGLDVVDKIGAVKTTTKQGHGDVPMETITIEKVSIDSE